MSPSAPGAGSTPTLFLGSVHDGITFPVPDATNSITMIVEDDAMQELARGTYTRRTIGSQSVFAIAALSNAQALERLLAGYDRERADA